MSESSAQKTVWQRLRRGCSLRLLMLIVLVLGGSFGWLAYGARVQRQAVAAIRKAGGGVTYDWQFPYFDRGSDIPAPPLPRWFFNLLGPDYLCNVKGVYLIADAGEESKVDDNLLAQVGRLDHLERLILINYAIVTDDSLIHFKRLKKLKMLNLALTGFKGSGLRHLQSLTELQILRLDSIPLTGNDLAFIKNMTKLRELSIDSPYITDSDLIYLERLPNPKDLTIACPQITSAGLDHLKGLNQLKRLDLHQTQVDSLEALKQLSGLQILDLDGTRIDDDGLAPISGFLSLDALSLGQTAISDAGLKFIADIIHLKALDLDGTKITDAGLVHLGKILHLELNLSRTQVTERGVTALEAKQSNMHIMDTINRLGPVNPEPPALSIVDSIIFQPRKYVKSEWPELDPSIKDIWFDSSDSLKLNGWYAAADHPRAVVLYTHGNAANIAPRRWILDLFRDRLGCSILIFDYRGYGRNEGTPTEAGVLADARAARQWLAMEAKVKETDIVLVGHSLGGGVAVDLAAKDGARGLILENTFTSLPDVAAKIFPLLPGVRFLVKTKLDSRSKIPNYHGPLLQTHGDADIVIPFGLGKRLFDAANEPKQFVPVRGGGHNDPPSREYLDAIDRFLGALPAMKPVDQP